MEKTSWNKETGVATVTVKAFGLEFVGIATCHEDDKDMQNQLTGLYIASYRAYKKLYQHKRNNILNPQLKILKKLMHEMQQGKYFDPRTQYVRLLRRKIAILTKELNECNKCIDLITQRLREYISDKEALYQKVRAKRLVKND